MPSAKKTTHLYDFQDEVYDHLSLANMWLNQQGNRGPITRGTFASFAAHKPRYRSRWSRCGMPKFYGTTGRTCCLLALRPYMGIRRSLLKLAASQLWTNIRFFLQFADVETYFGKSWRKVSLQLKILTAATKIQLKNAGDIFLCPTEQSVCEPEEMISTDFNQWGPVSSHGCDHARCTFYQLYLDYRAVT